MSEETIEKTFPVSAPARLKLSNVRGKVEIHSCDAPEIHIVAIKHLDSGDAENTEIKLTQNDNGSVEVETHFPRNILDWLHIARPCRVDYAISAPGKCSLKVSLVSSDAEIAGFEGEFEIGTVSGDLILKDLRGPLHLHTISGDIRSTNLSGSLLMDTVSGDVCLEGSSMPSIKAETVSGKMDFQTTLGEGPYYCGSVSGGIRLRLPADTKCSIDMHSVSGKISSKIPITTQARMNGATLADVQGGGVIVRMNSVSGCLVLEPG